MMEKFKFSKERVLKEEDKELCLDSIWDDWDTEIDRKQEVKEMEPYNPDLFLNGKFSIVFNGQGSHPPLQEIRDVLNDKEFIMANDISNNYNIHKDLLSFLANCTEKEYEDLLADTAINQVIIYTYQQIIYNYFNEYWNKTFNQSAPRPISATGNSLGIYNAYTSAGNIDFNDGINIVAERGRCMRLACEVNPDAELRIITGLPPEILEHLNKYIDFSIAHYNSPTQTTISGDKIQIDLVTKALLALINKIIDKNDTEPNIQKLKRSLDFDNANPRSIRKKIKILKSKVKGAFHSKYMEPALAAFESALTKLPLHNTDIRVFPDDGNESMTQDADIKKSLLKHLTHHIRFTEALKKMGAKAIIVFGGRQTSANFSIETLPEIKNNIISLTTKNEIEKFIEKLRDETRI